ncbi:hypothetical protein SPONN_1493 [uncultured Candidatus Thioglobus sp.]|nr:hypothetical protein SPONN_1493 [uncultured Candidatus Thioglobus sp.]
MPCGFIKNLRLLMLAFIFFMNAEGAKIGARLYDLFLEMV